MKETLDEVKAYAVRIDKASTAIAAKIQAAIDVDDTTVEDIRAALEGPIAALEALGTDPANPGTEAPVA